jgi:PPOX class probable F420-dependent enzyme
MISTEHRKFLEEHRLCIVGFDRREGPPSLSPVYYVVDGDDLLISTMASRGKAKQARRTGEVTLCVLGEQFPFPYLTVYGTCRVEDDGAVDVMMRIGEKMTGNRVPEAARPGVEERARKEVRVVLRVTPTRFFTTRL